MAEILTNESEEKKSMSFIEQMVVSDLAEGKNGALRTTSQAAGRKRKMGKIDETAERSGPED